jgi:hypothetical protein
MATSAVNFQLTFTNNVNSYPHIVMAKCVHLRDETRPGAPPACGTKLVTRMPDFRRTSDTAMVTCKRCLKVMK